MKKLILSATALCALCNLGYCKAATVKVSVTPTASEIFFGQAINATVEVTNIGKDSLTIPRPDRAVFSSLLSVDNSNLNFSGGVGIISVMGESPTSDLKPGETVKTKISLSGSAGGSSEVKFRVGFKPTVNSPVVWSNPTTIHLQKIIELPLPVSVQASLKTKSVDISNIQKPESATAHLLIKNISSGPEDIGMAGACCQHELADSLISDNDDIKIESGMAACLSSACAADEITLQPGQSWEQDCQIAYWGDTPNPKPIAFRIGVRPRGRKAAFSLPLTVAVAGGTDQWTNHIVWVKGRMKEAQVTSHPDGVSKTYYENGNVMDEYTYKGGKLNGPYKRYYDNGKLWEELNYVDNTRDGRDKSYDKTSKLAGESIFSNNQMIGYITYDPDGSIHHHVKTMKLVNGNYVPLQNPCAENDSDEAILKTMPHCSASGN